MRNQWMTRAAESRRRPTASGHLGEGERLVNASDFRTNAIETASTHRLDQGQAYAYG